MCSEPATAAIARAQAPSTAVPVAPLGERGPVGDGDGEEERDRHRKRHGLSHGKRAGRSDAASVDIAPAPDWKQISFQFG